MILDVWTLDTVTKGGIQYPASNLCLTFVKHFYVFRIFDSLNWVEAMKVSIKAVNERTESLAEACICYTGDLTSPENKK